MNQTTARCLCPASDFARCPDRTCPNARTAAAEDDESEMDNCEVCGGESPVGDGVRMCDCMYRQACYDAWLEMFQICDHAWEPESSPDGDPGRHCPKCGGFVEDAD